MKALTVWQPWASLIIWGFKDFETRTWKTNYRGWLAIHAAKRWKADQVTFIASNEYVKRVMDAMECTIEDLPLGAVVGRAYLDDIFKTNYQNELTVGLSEISIGDWSPGRFAWRLCTKRRIVFPNPVFARGRQGIWDWEPHSGR